MNIARNIYYVGVSDKKLDLFEGQYRLKNGITYNSYIIKDKKIAIIDTVDKRVTEEWFANINRILKEKSPDYLVISHLEPDHSDNIKALAERYPNMKIVGNEKTFAFMPQFFELDNLEERKIVVKEDDVLELGKHKLRFIMAPMVHWPEVMMEYEETSKTLFSADAFGKFGVIGKDENEDNWLDEARRYYMNIVGKYGVQVQALIKKISNTYIETICPLHGPILNNNIEFYIDKYNVWSSYEAESDGTLIVCATMHDYTLEACTYLKNMLSADNREVKLVDLTRADITKTVGEAFKYKNLILACSTYNAELMPAMNFFLNLLKSKGFQNRRIGYIENGTWSPVTAKLMKEITKTMRNIENIEPVVTLRTKLSDDSRKQLKKLLSNI